MRFSGYDHIIISGKAEKPVCLMIENGEKPKLIDAGDLWGLDVEETNSRLKKKYKNCAIACIGPAGENLVKFACIIVSGHHAVGRTGMGCVMGSKKLKAIVISANQSVPIYYVEKFNEIKKRYSDLMMDAPRSRDGSENGSLFLVNVYNSKGWLLCENGQRGKAKEAENLYVEVFKEKYQKGKASCFSCPIACQKKYEIKEGKYKKSSEKIDFGSIAYLGPNLGIYNYEAVLHLDYLACKYGMDTMELGAVIGLAMECYQRGIINKDISDGMELKWGDVDSIEKLIPKICYRNGFGAILAEGVRIAGKKLKGEKYGFNVKGIACPLMANNRNDWALGYVTSTRGGDHLKNFPFSTMFGPQSKQFARRIFSSKAAVNPGQKEESGRVVWWHENYKALIDSLGLCIFAFSGVALMGHPLYDDISEIFHSVTGIQLTGEDMFYAAERIYQIEKAFNVRLGISKKDEKLPVRHIDGNIDKEYAEGSIIDYEHPGMLQEYYKYRGYNKDGFPVVKRLKEVSLEQIIKDLGENVVEDDVPSLKEMMKTVNINI
jgi:aldehyde:ferredoxin oxidoreductase